jgi:hypothetical protein
VGTFWDDLERLLGCHTPRIDKQGTKALFESMPPPGALVPELELPNVAAMKRQERAQAPTVAFAEQAASPDLSPARRAPDLVRPAAAPAPVPARPSNPSEFLQRGSGVEQVGARLGGGAASGLALDGVSLVPGTFPSAGRRPVPASVARDHTLPPGVAASVLLRRLQAPLKLLAFGAAIAAAAWIYFLATGELFRVGPIGPFFLAGPIVIVAFMWIVVALFREQR